MKNLISIIAIIFAASGCGNKTDAEAERQMNLKDTYRVPPPSDPAEDQWTKPRSEPPKSRGSK